MCTMRRTHARDNPYLCVNHSMYVYSHVVVELECSFHVLDCKVLNHIKTASLKHVKWLCACVRMSSNHVSNVFFHVCKLFMLNWLSCFSLIESRPFMCWSD